MRAAAKSDIPFRKTFAANVESVRFGINIRVAQARKHGHGDDAPFGYRNASEFKIAQGETRHGADRRIETQPLLHRRLFPAVRVFADKRPLVRVLKQLRQNRGRARARRIGPGEDDAREEPA